MCIFLRCAGHHRMKYDKESLLGPRGTSLPLPREQYLAAKEHRQDAESRWGPSMPRPRAGASQTPRSYSPVRMPVLELLPPGAYLLAYLFPPHNAQLMPSSPLSRNGLSWSPLPFPALQLLPNQVLWIEKSNRAGLALVMLPFKYYNWTKAFVLTG